MFCSNCGKQVEEGSRFCPLCGRQLSYEAVAPVVQQPEAQQQPAEPEQQVNAGQPHVVPPPFFNPITRLHILMWNMLMGGPYLTLCIINTVVTVLGYTSGNIDIISTIVVVMMWLLRDCASKRKPPMEMAKNLKGLKIIATINYVVLWVLVGLLVVAGCGVMFVTDWIADDMTFLNEIMTGYEAVVLEAILSSGFLLGIVLIIIAVLVALYNIFFMGNCCKCAESFIRSCETGFPVFEKIGTLIKWFRVLGLFNILSAALSFTNVFTFRFPLGIVFMIASFFSSIIVGATYLLIAKCLDEFEKSLYWVPNEVR